MRIFQDTFFMTTAAIALILSVGAAPATWTVVSRTSDDTPTVAVKVADVASKASSAAIRAKSRMDTQKTVVKAVPTNRIDTITRDTSAPVEKKRPLMLFLR